MSCIPRTGCFVSPMQTPAVFHVVFSPSSESPPKAPIRVTFTFQCSMSIFLYLKFSRNSSVFMVISFFDYISLQRLILDLKTKSQCGDIFTSHKGNYEMKCTDVQKSVLQLQNSVVLVQPWPVAPMSDHISWLMPGHWLHLHSHSLGLWWGVFHMDIIWWKCHISWCWNKVSHNCLWKAFSALPLQLTVSLI